MSPDETATFLAICAGTSNSGFHESYVSLPSAVLVSLSNVDPGWLPHQATRAENQEDPIRSARHLRGAMDLALHGAENAPRRHRRPQHRRGPTAPRLAGGRRSSRARGSGTGNLCRSRCQWQATRPDRLRIRRCRACLVMSRCGPLRGITPLLPVRPRFCDTLVSTTSRTSRPALASRSAVMRHFDPARQAQSSAVGDRRTFCAREAARG